MSLFFSAKYLPVKRYANGTATNILENVPDMIPTPTVNANDFIRPSPNRYIAITINKSEIDVPRDLLIVCHTLSSNTCQINFFLELIAHSAPWRFSLIRSKITIVSLMLYAIVVNRAIIKMISTWTVWLIAISIPYPPAILEISKSIVTIVTIAKISGGTNFLIAPKAIIIYTMININHPMIAWSADFLTYSQTLAPMIDDSSICFSEEIILSFVSSALISWDNLETLSCWSVGNLSNIAVCFLFQSTLTPTSASLNPFDIKNFLSCVCRADPSVIVSRTICTPPVNWIENLKWEKKILSQTIVINNAIPSRNHTFLIIGNLETIIIHTKKVKWCHIIYWFTLWLQGQFHLDLILWLVWV